MSDVETLGALAGAELGPGAKLAVDAAMLWSDLARAQEPDLAKLRSLGPPVVEVPLLPAQRHDLNVTRQIGSVLAEASA
jgi:hypothetical protein